MWILFFAVVMVIVIVALILYFIFRGKRHEEEYDRVKSFTDVYRENKWGSKHPNGDGSLDENTTEDRKALSHVIVKYSIRSLLDAPCGLFSWMRHVVEKYPHIQYSGVDIVPDQIKTNQKNYPHLTFFQGDLSTTPLKKYDLIFSKECTQHLTEHTSMALLRNIVKSGSTFLLITSYDVPANSDENIDPDAPLHELDAGAYREQNMLLPPYSDVLTEPLERFWIRKNPFTQTPQYLQLFRLQKT